jgi:predicted MFS family arabinose efflux permease
MGRRRYGESRPLVNAPAAKAPRTGAVDGAAVRRYGRAVLSTPGRVVALLSLLNLVNYVDRYVLAAILPLVKADLALTDAQSGWLQTAFLIGYLVAGPVFAALARTVSRRALLAAGVFVFGAATVASGYAQDFAAMMIARAVVGVGEASYAALAPTFIEEHVAPAARGKALAAFYVMAPLGAAFGYAIGAGVAGHLGWRSSFYVTGIPAVVLALSSLALHETGSSAGTPSAIADMRELLTHPVYRLNMMAYTAFTFTIGGFSYWAPTFVSRELGMAMGSAATGFGAAAGLGGLVGSLVGGFLYDHLRRGRPDGEADLRVGLGLCAYTTLAAVPLVTAAFFFGSATSFYAFVAPALVLLFTSNAPVNAVILRSAPPHLRAQAMGLCIAVIHLFGDLWSPPLVGFVSDRTGSLRAGCVVFPIALVLAGFLWHQAIGAAQRLNAESATLK